ncbi:cold shock domain-containing protein, partial [Candidatus Woesearchaeota archaeon]|nr:cold shock domain-containing protein [Candidatus Woesearchaeota archaeon]
DDGEDYFVHESVLPPGAFLRENDRVSFEPAQTERGKQAQKVVLSK